MSRPSHIDPTEIIDVDALPECTARRTNKIPFRRASNRTSTPQSKSTATIDLTNVDDSDSDISISSVTTKPGGSGTPGVLSNGKEKEEEMNSAIGLAIEKIRKRGRPTATSSGPRSHSQALVPPMKKLKLSTSPPGSREQSTSTAKLANGGNASASNDASTSALSLSDLSLILTQGKLSQAALAEIAQTMMSQALSHSLPPSSGPSTTTAAASSSKKDKGKRTFIELSSDGEEVVELVSAKKRQKRTAASFLSPSLGPMAGPSTIIDVQYSDQDPGPDVDPSPDVDIESDEELSYDYIHAGYDIHDPDIWTPISTNLNRLQEDGEEDEVVNNMEQLTVSEFGPGKHLPPRYVHPDISSWYPSKITCPPIFIWDHLRMARNLRYPSRPRPTPLQSLKKPFTRPWDLDFNLHRLKAVHSFKESPGSINKIEQKAGWTVIASACTGGLPDTENEELSPYNRPGSLITWRNHLDIPDGHRIRKGDQTKHYAVHDLKFFPNRMSFVSSGADSIVRLWNLPSDGEDDVQGDAWFSQRLQTFNASPHDLAFKPNTSILAVAEKKIHVFTFHDAEFEVSAEFSFFSSRLPHVIGSLAWGIESTAGQLFGSSEPCFSTIFDGIHKALDVTAKRMLYQFDASEAGDVLSLDSTGATLALSTRAPENKHLLRIYDTRRKLPTATHLIELESFPTRDDFEGEVNNASFSPDGMYLALARNDNRTHVYDRRMWDRGVIFEYGHDGDSKAASPKDVYGVVKAQWVQSEATGRIALVTGGEDGCIRMWDPTMSAQNPKNGKILAEVNSDIGHFSLGDPYAGENQLVVGDNTGEVTIFNNVVI
ncbi:WD40 repeat-like protein [Phlegmacium glaucopus]|nr:WD40 repeat-like protein [Phlegmacium glaucopus]